MVKLIGLVRKRAGMSRDAFIDYYENSHAPLIRRIAPIGDDYRRNYVMTMRVEGREATADPEFDAVTEVWFQDRAAYEAFSNAMQDPDIRGQVVADEEMFLDRSATRIMIVDERRSPA